jgi:hypothetical protein
LPSIPTTSHHDLILPGDFLPNLYSSNWNFRIMNRMHELGRMEIAS